jgi:pyrroline-5-carboxylate reductase
MNKKIVFVGAGNMAEALVKGLLEKGLATPGDITVTDISQDRLDWFAAQYGTRTLCDNAEAVRGANVVFLAIKPQQFDPVLADLKTAVASADALVVSIAAGITCERIEAALGGARVVRVMPNTPALVSCGAAGICGGSSATAQDLALVGSVFNAIGTAVQVEEEMMDAVTALSGSGPAYVFYLIEAMQQTGEELGLDAQMARDLAVQTVRGAAELCAVSGEPAGVLRERVTSKGGTTQAALAVLNKREVAGAVHEAMRAARDRSRELAAG